MMKLPKFWLMKIPDTIKNFLGGALRHLTLCSSAAEYFL